METKRKSFLARAAMTLLVTLLLTMTAQTAWAGTLTATSGTCGTNCTWTFNTTTGQLTISGTGAMADYSWNWDGNPSPFFWCTNIKSVVVSEGVTRIGDKTFHNCTGIETVSLPKTLATIGESAFLSCTAITAFTVATENSSFASDDGLLYNADKTTLLNFPPAKTGTVTIPSTVTTLSNSAFNGATGITSLDLSACTSLTTISASLCYGCTALASVTLPASITVIDEQAFGGCNNLTTINLSECTALTMIRLSAFYGCGLLAGTHTLPNTVTCIGSNAFNNCSALQELVIQSSLATFADDPNDDYDVNGFGGGAFDGCTALKLNIADTNLAEAMLGNTNKWYKYANMLKTMPFTVSGVTLSSANHYLNATFDMTSNTAVEVAKDIYVNTVNLTRTLASNKPCTVMFPFAATPDHIGGGTFYEFTGVTYDDGEGKWKATMTAKGTYDNLTANTPYLLVPSATAFDNDIYVSGMLNTTTGTRETTVGDWTFKGVYAEKTWTAGDVGNDYGFAATSGTATDGVTPVSGGDFVKIAAGAHIKPMRAYLTYTGSGNPWAASAPAMNRAASSLPSSISVVLVEADGSTTTVGTIHMERNAEGWYSLDGMQLDSKPTQKGLYIHNGRKEVVK